MHEGPWNRAITPLHPGELSRASAGESPWWSLAYSLEMDPVKSPYRVEKPLPQSARVSVSDPTSVLGRCVLDR